jgi:hypothetical protein
VLRIPKYFFQTRILVSIFLITDSDPGGILINPAESRSYLDMFWAFEKICCQIGMAIYL